MGRRVVLVREGETDKSREYAGFEGKSLRRAFARRTWEVVPWFKNVNLEMIVWLGVVALVMVKQSNVHLNMLRRARGIVNAGTNASVSGISRCGSPTDFSDGHTKCPVYAFSNNLAANAFENPGPSPVSDNWLTFQAPGPPPAHLP